MEKKIENVCRAAVRVFGDEHQTRKAVEEMGELLTALARLRDGRASEKEVITEIADVLITVSQLGIMFGIDEVSREVERKIDRLAGRIAEKLIDDFQEGIAGDRVLFRSNDLVTKTAEMIKSASSLSDTELMLKEINYHKK